MKSFPFEVPTFNGLFRFHNISDRNETTHYYHEIDHETLYCIALKDERMAPLNYRRKLSTG